MGDEMNWKDYDLTPDRLAMDCTEAEADEYNRLQADALRLHFEAVPPDEAEIAKFIGANWLTWLRRAMSVG